MLTLLTKRVSLDVMHYINKTLESFGVMCLFELIFFCTAFSLCFFISTVCAIFFFKNNNAVQQKIVKQILN